MNKAIAMAIMVVGIFCSAQAFAEIKYINGYTRKNGTYVSGHYRDTSGDGYEYNNANYLGYND